MADFGRSVVASCKKGKRRPENSLCSLPAMTINLPDEEVQEAGTRVASDEPPRMPFVSDPRKFVRPALWTLCAGIVLAVRFPDWLLRPRLWAEDGNVFFPDARTLGLYSLVKPSAGYLHTVPRLIALAGNLVDPVFIPPLYVYGSLLVTLWVVARLFSPRLDLPNKPLLALAIVAVPTTGEVFLCPVNIQWILALSLVTTLFMRDPQTRFERAGDYLGLFLVGLTGPFGIVLLPFFLVRALVRRTSPSWQLLGILAATSLVQLWEIHLQSSVPRPEDAIGALHPFNLFAVTLVRVPLAVLGSHSWVPFVSRPFAAIVGTLFALALTYLVFRKDEQRKVRVVLMLIALALCALAVARVRDDRWNYRENAIGDRYFYIEKVLVLWIVATSFCTGQSRAGNWVVTGLLVASFCISLAPYYEYPPFKDRHQERPFYPWDPYCGALRDGLSVQIRFSPGWTADIPGR